jgi:hypothetical protein
VLSSHTHSSIAAGIGLRDIASATVMDIGIAGNRVYTAH